MHFLHTLAAVAALSTVTLSAPAEKRSHGFTVEQVATGKKVHKNGAKSVMDTYLKYNAPVPENVRVAATQTGSVTATPESYDKEYLCPVSVGTPAQSLSMDFDTGSSDLWVFSTLQPAGQRTGHVVYHPGLSSTARKTTGTWAIHYGDGSGASGDVYYDKVVIGGATATSQAVEAATSVSSSFKSDTQNDGLVGLAFDSINNASPRVATFMNNVGPTLPSNLFTAYLKKGAPGSYDFGFINSAKYTGTIYYTPVSTANGFWEFTATGYAVGGRSYSASLDSIADTGTSLIYMPAAVCNNYWGSVPGASYSNYYGGYVFPCSGAASLPNFSVTIGGSSRTVPGSYMNYAPAGGSTCFGGIQDSAGIGFNILGDVFLKSQYVVFDVQNTRIGFATQT